MTFKAHGAFTKFFIMARLTVVISTDGNYKLLTTDGSLVFHLCSCLPDGLLMMFVSSMF